MLTKYAVWLLSLYSIYAAGCAWPSLVTPKPETSIKEQAQPAQRSPVTPQAATPQQTAQPAQPAAPQPNAAPAPQAEQAPVPPRSPGVTPPPPPIPPTAAAPERKLLPSANAPAGGMVSLNFNRADLVEIIHILAQHLKLTYTIDPEVKGTVTIHSAEPLRTEDLLPIFHQVLRMNGAVAVKTGNLYRIMPIKDGKGLARPVGQSREDSFAIQIVPVRFFSVAEIKKLLTPFLAPGGEIIEHPRGNFLILIDLPSNIQRLVEIAEMMDVQVFAGTRMEIYSPKVASAEELGAEMTKVMQSFAASAPQAENFVAQFIPIPRINQLLVISHSEAAWNYAKQWLERIDVIAEGPGRRIFIYPVENGKAPELADVLSQALGQPLTARRDSARTLQDMHRSTTTTGFGQPGGGRSSTTQLGGTSATTPQTQLPGLYATVPVPGAPAAPAAPQVTPTPGAPARPPTPVPPGAKPEEQLRIVPDPATNSLIIYGTAQEFQNIRNILKDLDAVPRQVLMDVLVAEVTLGDDMSFGIDYEILRKGGDVRIFNREFGSRGGIITGTLPPAAETGLTQFGAGLSGVIGTGNAIRAFVNALATDSRVKVLSHPSVLATDNRPARIQVGSEEPIPTGTITQTVGTIAESTSIQYRNTGRIVTIIPQVNSQGLVNLQILAEVSQRGANVAVGPNTFPSFDIRQAETTAVVQDGESLVIGGIISERKGRSRTGIPYLMDLPVLGRFFGSSTDEIDRTELIMLITPHVIRNRTESRQVSEDFKNKLSHARNEVEKLRVEEELRRERLRLERERQLQEKDKESKQPEIPPSGPSSQLRKPGTARASPKQESAPAAAKKVSVSIDTANPTPTPLAGGPSRNLSSPTPAVKPSLPEPAKAEDTAKPTKQKPVIAVAAAKITVPKTADPPVLAAKKTKPTWTLQAAAFADLRDAENLVKDLTEKGYDARVHKAEVGGKIWYRVRVGELTSWKEALELQQALRTKEKLPKTFIAER